MRRVSHTGPAPARSSDPSLPSGASSAPHDRVLRNEIVHALGGDPKTLPPKLFYDARGAELFEQITTLEEYYLTRTELTILRAAAPEIAALAGPRCALIEYGSGAGVKIRLLLDALEEPVAYVPIDISREQLKRVAAALAADHPGLAVRPVHGDYTAPVTLPDLPPSTRRVAFFPGSTIGNFHPTEAAAFLRRVRRTVGRGGAMILGVDQRKDEPTLRAAYDDAQGVTAAFNRNVLVRLNREFGADFDLSRFAHRIVWNDEASRIEMHLASEGAQDVTIGGTELHFGDGETIWTESSYKYDRSRLDDLAKAAGFSLERVWSDPQDLFAVAFLTVPGDSA